MSTTATSDARRRVLVVVSESSVEHVTPVPHPESIDRYDAVITSLDAAPGVEWRAGRDADLAEIELVHRRPFIDELRSFTDRGGGQLDPDTFAAPGSFGAALGAAGSGLTAIEALQDDPTIDAAFVVARPPGHHATATRAFGFCLFNNVAIAAAHLADRGERVVIVDWDVHHGNGTQDIFWRHPDVMYVSLHQAGIFPGTGSADEAGEDAGRHTTINLPLPPGATGDLYLALFDAVVAPAVTSFAPTWVLVSAGFDAHAADPLADIALEEADFALLADRVRSLAPGPGRTALFLEGGYHLAALGRSVRRAVDTLAAGVAPDTRPTTGGPGSELL